MLSNVHSGWPWSNDWLVRSRDTDYGTMLAVRVAVKQRIVTCRPGRRESIALRGSCFAQAQGSHPGYPFDACVSPLEAAGETSVFRAPRPTIKRSTMIWRRGSGRL